MPTVTITSKGRAQSFPLRRGLGLQALAVRHATPLEFDCREADCGICIVRVREGLANLSDQTDAERAFLTAMRAEPDERLACQCQVLGDVDLLVEDADV